MSAHAMRVVLAALMATVGAAEAQPNTSVPIALQGTGPYHRLTLPLSIYGRAAYGDLSDLRVRNAAGHAVPYAWLRNEAAAPRTASQAVPIFALPGNPASGDTALAFTVRPDGSLALDSKTAAKPNDAAQWLIDVSQVKGSLLQARLEIAPDARGLFAFRLEASEDLRQWRPLGDEEQLVRLAHGGQTIERMAVDLGNLRTRFLRLRWSDPQRGAPLAKVEIDSVQEVEPVAPIEWSGALKPERCAEDHCDYLLPRGLPVQSLRIDLADINTLAQVGVSGLVDAAPASTSAPSPQFVPRNPLYALRNQQRRTTALPSGPGEAPLLDTVVYRLAQAGGEARSPVLALDGAVYSRLRLRTSGTVSVLGAMPPTIAVGATPRTLVFLAQGGAPFSLAWSTAADKGAVQGAVPGAPLALSTLIPGYAADKPVAADGASVTLPVAAVEAAVAAAALAPVPATAPHDPSRKWWLWGALGVGLLLLAGMAWSLFASLRKDRAATDRAG
jgi:hypothetical protein